LQYRKQRVDVLHSVDSDGLEKQEQDFVRHHHYIACKDYDRTIMKKVRSIMNLDHLNQAYQQDQKEEEGKENTKNDENSNLKNKTKKIMLVDDEADILWLFKMILESDARLKVDAFLDPIIALENFRPGLYDLLLIDIAMPKMNGFELYDKIRKLDKKVKVSFVTASEMFYEEIRMEAFPELDTTTCFIRKPIANPDLIQQVREILEIYSL
jgi:two-component system, OmpR family, response regulator ChvI